MSVVPNFESFAVSKTLRLKMCMDAHSLTATDGGGSKLREFALAANSKMKNVHGRTFFIDPLFLFHK